MFLQTLSPITVATKVWTGVSPREVTTLFPPNTAANGVAVSLASSGSTNFATADIIQQWQISIKAGAAGTGVLSINDGTNLYTVLTVTAGTTGSAVVYAQAGVVFPTLKNNDATNTLAYAYVKQGFN